MAPGWIFASAVVIAVLVGVLVVLTAFGGWLAVLRGPHSMGVAVTAVAATVLIAVATVSLRLSSRLVRAV